MGLGDINIINIEKHGKTLKIHVKLGINEYEHSFTYMNKSLVAIDDRVVKRVSKNTWMISRAVLKKALR